MNKIVERILAELGHEELLDKLLALPKPDLNSLLLELFKMQTQELTAAELLKSYHNNRFSKPALINPSDFHKFETELLTLAEKEGIEGILLSPCAPLGSCSVFGCVDQNNVISAVRGTETLSDPTNMLAVIISDKRKSKEAGNVPIHYCTTSRVARAQIFSGTNSFAHFGLFCMVSAGKDTGSYQCEKQLLIKQLSYYKELLLEKYNANLSISLRKRSGYTDGGGFFQSMSDLLISELPDVPVTYDLDHEDNQYYKGLNFKIYIRTAHENIEIGDGGFVDWTQKLTGSKKERCLISGIGLDRLLLLP